MSVCDARNCSKREQCANYIGNYKSNKTEQVIDWSLYGYGSIGIDKDGNTYCENHYDCGDLSVGYPMFQELQYDKPVDLQEVKEFIYNSLKRKYGNHVISERNSKDVVIDTKTKYLGNSDVWISLEYFH